MSKTYRKYRFPHWFIVTNTHFSPSSHTTEYVIRMLRGCLFNNLRVNKFCIAVELKENPCWISIDFFLLVDIIIGLVSIIINNSCCINVIFKQPETEMHLYRGNSAMCYIGNSCCIQNVSGPCTIQNEFSPLPPFLFNSIDRNVLIEILLILFVCMRVTYKCMLCDYKGI